MNMTQSIIRELSDLESSAFSVGSEKRDEQARDIATTTITTITALATNGFFIFLSSQNILVASYTFVTTTFPFIPLCS